jgi:hypothetical protein
MTALGRRTDGCGDCASELEHCHGVAVEHADGVPDCTEGSCWLPASLHAAAIACTETNCDCGLILIADAELPSRRRHAI